MFADKLRKSLLQAAIQGRLTEQLPTDGDARDLLKKIRDEKAKLIAAKKIKAEKPLSPVTDDEIPFELPANWCWCRLNDLYKFIDYRGKTPTKINSGVPLVTAKNVKAGYNDYTIREYISEDEYKTRQSRGVSHKGDILFTTEAPLGNVALADLETFSAGQRLITFQAYDDDSIVNRLMMFFLLSESFQKMLNDTKTGTTVAGIKAEKLKKLIIPLPPLAEQLRIVERLDALLSEVTELEKDERELNLHVKNFPQKMKNSLLQAAIQGRLTEQLPTDGDARDLLKKIRDEKAKLVAAKKIKAEKPLPSVTDDEIPFDLPANWCWCRLGEVCNYGTNETIQPSAMQIGKLLIELEDVEKDSGRLIKRKTFDGTNANSSKNIFRCGNVLFGKLRVYLNKVIIADTDGYCSSEILPLDFGKNILSRYAQIVLMSPPFISYANACSYGTKMPRLGTKAGQLALFPLPPLAEQLRIVERLNELLPLCEI